MQKGQAGFYNWSNSGGAGTSAATVERVRGGNLVDIRLGDELVQMVPVGPGENSFWPMGFTPQDAPPPALPARLVPRYIPIWHAVVLGIPVAAGTAILTVLAWLRWLN